MSTSDHRSPQPNRLPEPVGPYGMYLRLLHPPTTRRCVICAGPEPAEDLYCERCGTAMHWDCYWDCVGSRAEYRGAKRHARNPRSPRVLILCHGCRS